MTSPVSEVRAWAAQGSRFSGPFLDVSQAAPGYPPPPEMNSYLAQLDPTQVSKYGPVLGDKDLREILAAHISTDYLGTVHPDQVAITSGANQAFCLAIAVLCGPGDQVILPVPYYFNHHMWLTISGVEPVYLPCSEGMLPTVEQAASLINDRTKAIVLVTPNNPTGAVYPSDLIHEFAQLSADQGIFLILDETYRQFRTTTAPAHLLFQDTEWARTVIHIESFSKVYSIPGLRVGAMAAAPQILRQVDKAADCVTICPNRIGQAAVRFGLEHLEDWVDSNRLTLNHRVDRFVKAMENSVYRVASPSVRGNERKAGRQATVRRLRCPVNTGRRLRTGSRKLPAAGFRQPGGPSGGGISPSAYRLPARP